MGPRRAEAAEEIAIEGMRHLRAGRFELGWELYEARHAVSGYDSILRQPLWRGEDLTGKAILVYREQGIGDEIWFASCFPDLLAVCEDVTISCDQRLLSLFRRSFPKARFLGAPRGHGDQHRWSAARVDYQTPAGNLGRYFRDRIEKFPSAVRYLVPDPERRAHWRSRLEHIGPGPRVGISWQGGIDLENLRQAPWSFWERVLRPGRCAFVNLQAGASGDVLANVREHWGVEIHDWDDLDLLDDMEGQAALIAELDLVVSVPNTTVHLASAIGRPCWIVFDDGWGCFWITNGERSPWYPRAEVLKPRTLGWAELGRSVAERLGDLG